MPRSRKSARNRPSIEPLESRRLLSATFNVAQLTSLPTSDSSSYGPSRLTTFGNDLLFQATDPSTGRSSLWLSDGTVAGTQPLPTPGTGDKLLVGVSGSQIYFAATLPGDSIDGGLEQSAELFVTADQGATVTDLGPVAGVPELQFSDGFGYGGVFGASATLGGKFYFITNTNLFVSDGTLAGTQALPTTPGISITASDSSMAVIGQTLFINGDGQLYATDGPFSDLHSLAPISSEFPSMVPFDGKLYFLSPVAAAPGVSSFSTIWTTDGTTAGTVDLGAGDAVADTLPNFLTISAVGNKLFLVGIPRTADITTPNALYTSDGTLNSIVRVPAKSASGADINNFPLNITAFDDQAVFIIPSVGTTPSQLWTSNGSAAGTHPLVSVPSTSASLFVVDDNLFAASPDSSSEFHAATTHLGPGNLFIYGQVTTTPTPTAEADLTATLTHLRVTKIIVPGDPILVTLSINNSGTATSAGTALVQFYLSPDGQLTDAAPLNAAIQINIAGITAGGSQSFPLRLTLPANTPTGTQNLLAVLSPGDGNVTSSVNTVIDTTPVSTPLASRIDSAFGAGERPSLTIENSVDIPIEFSLRGGGHATFSETGNDGYQLVVTGAAASALVIETTNAKTSAVIASLAVIGDLGQLVLTRTSFGTTADTTGGAFSITGRLQQLKLGNLFNTNLTFGGNAGRVTLGNVEGSSLSFGANVSSISIGNADESHLSLSGAAPATFSALAITGFTVASTAPFRQISFSSWTTDSSFASEKQSLSAASIGTLTCRGEMDVDVTTTSAGIGLIRANKIDASTWSSAGPINSVIVPNSIDGTFIASSFDSLNLGLAQVTLVSRGNIGTIKAGSIYGSNILAGMNPGADTALGGGDDTFSAAKIKSIQVKTTVQLSLIAAGLDVTNDTFPPLGGESLLPGSSIGSILVGTSIDSTSRFLAASLPATAKIGRQKVPTASDPRFAPITAAAAQFQLTQLTQFSALSAGSAPTDPTVWRTDLFFLAPDSTTGKIAAWVSDGTAAGTVPLTLPSGTTAGDITGLSAGDLVLFTDGTNLWRTDGTPAGTSVVSFGTGPSINSHLSLLGYDSVADITTTNGSTTTELWGMSNADSSGAVDMGQTAGAIDAVAIPETVGGSGFTFSIGPDIWQANEFDTPHLELLATIPNATKIEQMTSNFVVADMATVPAGSTGQQLWDIPAEVAPIPVMLLDAVITNLLPGSEDIEFTAQRASDTAPSLWATEGQQFATQFLVDSSPVYNPAYNANGILGFQSPDSTVLKAFFPTVGSPTVKTIGDVGSFKPSNNLVTVTNPSIGIETLILAPTPAGSLGLWDVGAPNVEVASLPNGQLITANNLLFEVTPSSQGTPGQLFLLQAVQS